MRKAEIRLNTGRASLAAAAAMAFEGGSIFYAPEFHNVQI